MRLKGRNSQVASVLHHNPEVLLPLEVPNFNKVGLEGGFEEEEVLNRGDQDQFPMVEVDIIPKEDLEAIL